MAGAERDCGVRGRGPCTASGALRAGGGPAAPGLPLHSQLRGSVDVEHRQRLLRRAADGLGLHAHLWRRLRASVGVGRQLAGRSATGGRRPSARLRTRLHAVAEHGARLRPSLIPCPGEPRRLRRDQPGESVLSREDDCEPMNPSMAPDTAAALSPLPDGPSPGKSGRPEALVESYRRLAEVFHEVLSEQSLDALLDRIAVTLADLMPYEALHIYEADDGRRELVPLLARSQEYHEEIMRSRPRYGEGITGWAVANRRPVWTNRAHLDPRTVTVPWTPNDPEAMITVPLIARGALNGALNIYRIGEEAG